MLREERRRKIRSDKKRQIRPTVDIEMSEAIYRLSTITFKPVKDICEILICNAVNNDEIIQSLSHYLKRDVFVKNTLFRGHIDNENLYDVYSDGKRNRLSFTVTLETYERLHSLAYCFGTSISKISAVLIFEQLTDTEFIEEFLEEYLDSLNESKKKELKQLLKYIQSQTDHKFSLADLLVYLVEQPIKWIFGEEERK